MRIRILADVKATKDNKRQSMLPEFGNGGTFQSEFLKFNISNTVKILDDYDD